MGKAAQAGRDFAAVSFDRVSLEGHAAASMVQRISSPRFAVTVRVLSCMPAFAILFALFTIFAVCPASAAVIYVNGITGNDANDGLDWSRAKKTVQAGINASSAADEVWVAAGTYPERITLKADVALYGGFAGYEVNREQRNWQTNQTILDGEQGGPVVTASDIGNGTTLVDGFTIRNGQSRYSGGGGIYCFSSSPTIANNTITANSADWGGGIYCNSSSPTIINNTITANSVDWGWGRGIHCYVSSPTIANNIINK